MDGEIITLPRPPHGSLVGTVDWIAPNRSSAVLFVHGFGSDRQGNKPTAVHHACRRHGLNFAAFDFHCHGESCGQRMTDLRASGLLQDLTVIRDHLGSRGAQRLYLVGSSMGGFASSWFALNNPVAALVLMAPAFRFLEHRLHHFTGGQLDRWKAERTIRLTNEWLDIVLDYGLIEEREQFPYERLVNTWRTPALVFQGMCDDTVPWQETLDLLERTAFTDIELRLLRGGDHRLLDHAEDMAEEACRYFLRHGA